MDKKSSKPGKRSKKRAKPLEDLPKKRLTAEDAKAVKGGASSPILLKLAGT